MSLNKRSIIYRGVESLYGAIIITMLILSFISIYLVYKEDQIRSYDDIMNSLDLEYERLLEKIYVVEVNLSSNQIFLNSNIDTDIIGILLINNSSTYYINLSNNSVRLVAGETNSLPANLSSEILNYAKQGYKIYLLSKRGNMILLNIDPFIRRISDEPIYKLFDYVFYAEKDVYYIIYGNWDVYVYNQTLGSPQIYPYVYFWDINTSYTIFKAPENTYIYLKSSFQNRSILETKKWFKAPTILYAQDPTDLRIVFNIYLDSPYLGRWVTIYWGSGITNISYYYNGSIVINTSVSWVYPGGLQAYWRYSNSVPPKIYNFTVIVKNFGLPIIVRVYHTLITQDQVYRFIVGLAWTGTTNDYYFPYLFSSINFINGNEYVGSDLYKNIDFSFNVPPGMPTQGPSPEANEVDFYAGIVGYIASKYYLNTFNVTIYSPINGYILASNGNKIYDLSPQIYYGWSYR